MVDNSELIQRPVVISGDDMAVAMLRAHNGQTRPYTQAEIDALDPAVYGVGSLERDDGVRFWCDGVSIEIENIMSKSDRNESISASYGETTNTGPILNPLLDLLPLTQQAVIDAGFVENGSGFVYDSVNGVKCTAGTLEFDTNTFSSLMSAQGSIYLEIERAGAAMDEPQNAGVFIQSTGDTSFGQRYILQCNDTINNDEIRLYWETNGNLNWVIKSGGITSTSGIALNSNGSATIDSDFARVILTWIGTTFRILVDGIVVLETSLTNAVNSTMLSKIKVGGRGGATSPYQYYIKRIQLSDKLFTPVFEPQKTVMFGDSFAQAFFNNQDISTLSEYATAANTSLITNAGGFDVVKFFWRDRGKLLDIVSNATTEQGHGWVNDGNPFSVATLTAVATANPDYIICFGSVNDVSSGPTPFANVLADTKSRLDTLIDGSSNLRKILFFECFPGHKNLINNTADFIANYETYINQQSSVDGYRGIVKYINTYQDFGGLDYNPEFTIGSATGNIVNPDNDIHPSRLGHIKMAEIVYPAVVEYLYPRKLI